MMGPLVLARLRGALLLSLALSPLACVAPPIVPDPVASGTDSSLAPDEPPTDEEASSGRTFRDIYKPVVLPCAAWVVRLKQAEGACAKNLFVEGCGEKDADGKPTGLYAGNACPACELLTGMRKQAKDNGCQSS